MFSLTLRVGRILAVAAIICALNGSAALSIAQEESKVALAAAPQNSASRGKQKTQPVLSDEALQRAIISRFAASKIASNGFTVSVSGGRATLRGTAGVAQHKGVATRLAKAAGAREVVNQIVIGEKARASLQRKSPAKKKGNPRSSAPEGRQRQAEVNASTATEQLPRNTSTNTPVEPGKESGSKSNLDASNGTEARLKRFRVVGPGSHKRGRSGELRRY